MGLNTLFVIREALVIGLIGKAFLLSHPSFHQKSLEFVILTFLKNDYPLSFICQIVHKRLKSLFEKTKSMSISKSHNNDEIGMKLSFFNIPYVKFFSEQFGLIVRDLDTKLSYININKLQHFIRVHKDVLPNYSRSNVVYRIACRDCDASYVGQTCRTLKTRIAEHRNHINRNISQSSVITDHRLTNHDFEWDNVEVLGEEPFLGKD